MVIATQIYVFTRLPDLTARMPGILLSLAEAGYEGIEGMIGHPPEGPEPLAAAGLKCLATHCGTARLSAREDVLSACRTMGTGAICNSGLPQADRRSAEDYAAGIAAINALAAEYSRDGVTLHYHNHDFEFEAVDGRKTGMDLLLEGLDFSQMKLCLDLGWAHVAGADAVALLRDHADKIGFVHLRDFSGRASRPLGQGEIDLAPQIEAIRGLPNLQALVVEQDPDTEDPLGDTVAGRRYLRERFGL